MNTLKTAIAVLVIAGAGTAGYKGTVSEKPVDRQTPGEIVELRTPNAKVWDTGTTVYDSTLKRNLKVMYARNYMNDIHYRDKDGKFRSPDLVVKQKPWAKALLSERKFEINSGIFKADFDTAKVYNYGFENNGASVTYKVLFDTTKAVEVYANVVNDGIKETIILKDDTAPSVLQWMVSLDGTAKEAKSGWDVANSKGEFAFHIAAVTAVDAKNKPLAVTAELDKGYITAVVDTKDAAYPITVDPGTGTITAVNDAWMRASGANDYLLARDATTGAAFTASPHQVGQEIGYAGSDSSYTVSRTFHHYPIAPSLNIVSVTACSTYYYCSAKYTDYNFLLYHVLGNHKGAPATGWFNDFQAWTASGAYIVTSTYLTQPKNTSAISAAAYNFQAYTALGLDSLNACVARADTHRVIYMSEEDINSDAPLGGSGTTLKREYIQLKTSADSGQEPYLSFTYTVANPTGLIATAISSSQVQIEWDNNVTGETQIYVKDYDTDAVIDSMAADTTIDTVTVATPNTKYRIYLEIDGGTADGNVSLPDSCRTWAAVPAAPVVDTLKVGGLYGFLRVRIDTTGTKNPSTTLYAIRDKGAGTTGVDTAFVVPTASGYDTLRTGGIKSSWAWGTISDWGGTAGDTLIYPPGNMGIFEIFSKNSQ